MVLEKYSFCSHADSESNFTKKRSDPVQQGKYISSHMLQHLTSTLTWINGEMLQLACQTINCMNICYDKQKQIKRRPDNCGKTGRGHLKRQNSYSWGFALESYDEHSDVCIVSSPGSASSTKEKLIGLQWDQHHQNINLFPKPSQKYCICLRKPLWYLQFIPNTIHLPRLWNYKILLILLMLNQFQP